MPNDETRYDDKQVGLILRRATELATANTAQSVEREGFSLAELEQIAQEAGIDPALVRQAATEVEGSNDEGEWRWVMGAPLSIRVHRVVDVEVPEDFFDDLLAEIHVAGIGHGTASLVGRTLSWKGSGTGQHADSFQVTISSRDGRTDLRGERKRSQAMGGLLGGLVGGGGVGVGVGVGLPIGMNVIGSALAATALPIAAVGGAYWLARKLYQNGHTKKKRQLEALLDTLVERIREEAAKRVPPPGQAPQLPGGS